MFSRRQQYTQFSTIMWQNNNRVKRTKSEYKNPSDDENDDNDDLTDSYRGDDNNITTTINITDNDNNILVQRNHQHTQRCWIATITIIAALLVIYGYISGSNKRTKSLQNINELFLAHSRQQYYNNETSATINTTIPKPKLKQRRLKVLRKRKTKTNNNNDNKNSKKKQKILYIVTTLAEYNTGSRSTTKGSDRLQETLIPVISESVISMINDGNFDVDVFLVCHYKLLPERYELIKSALPNNVNLDYWDNATPLGYDTSKKPNFTILQNRTEHLSRQHRFVIKDKFLEYDIFVNFEDDMVIKAQHVQHYIDVTNELYRLEQLAPDENDITNKKDAEKTFYGTMTKQQLRRMIPGFMRVEVLLDEEKYPAQSNTGPVPVDMDFNDNEYDTDTVDASICCHVTDHLSGPHTPSKPNNDQLMIWETNILPLGIRQMPTGSWLNWVVLQRGPNQNNLNVNEIIGDYWSNRNTNNKNNKNTPFFGNKQRRPAPQEFKYINNQGGWMATQKQLYRWHTEICPGGFLPPYDEPHYHYDGLDMRNVEWYSGGMQLSTVRHACNMQRIILLNPKHFSKSLLYHSANNKQRQLTNKRETTFVKANTLLGQLNTIKKLAEQEIE